jgi:hypothetical protein
MPLNISTGRSLLYNPPAAAAAASVSWTPTDAAVDEAVGFATAKQFSSRAIGSATATRQVLVAAAIANEGAAITFTCTVGGVTATAVSHGSSTTADVWLFQANVTSGTTANIVITGSNANSINKIAIGVGVLDGITAAASSIATAGTYSGSQNSPYSAGSSITVPAGGIGIGAAGVSSAPGTPAGAILQQTQPPQSRELPWL